MTYQPGTIIISHSHDDETAIAEVREQIAAMGLTAVDVKIVKRSGGLNVVMR